MQALDAKIQKWATGKKGNIRSLLSTLQYVRLEISCSIEGHEYSKFGLIYITLLLGLIPCCITLLMSLIKSCIKKN